MSDIYFIVKYYYIFFSKVYVIHISTKNAWLSSVFAFLLITFFYSFSFLDMTTTHGSVVFFMLRYFVCVKNCKSRAPRDTR